MARVTGIEIGTSSTKALMINDGMIAAIASSDGYEPKHPSPGASRQKPAVWWQAAKQAIRRVCKKAKVRPNTVDCVVVSGQMHGLVPNGTKEASLWNDTTAADWIDSIGTEADRRNLRICMKKARQIDGDAQLSCLLAKVQRADGAGCWAEMLQAYSVERARAILKQWFNPDLLATRQLRYERIDQRLNEILLGAK